MLCTECLEVILRLQAVHVLGVDVCALGTHRPEFYNGLVGEYGAIPIIVNILPKFHADRLITLITIELLALLAENGKMHRCALLLVQAGSRRALASTCTCTCTIHISKTSHACLLPLLANEQAQILNSSALQVPRRMCVTWLFFTLGMS